ncbi:MAG: hypothetical protein J7M38_06840, partial [Armatimonadetes bacterium]|nr:hypothetical protein [Armatimonadota bacterium]
MTPANSFDLPAGASDVRILAFVVPDDVAPGSYSIRYSVTSQRDYDIRGAGEITVMVRSVNGLRLLVENAPDQVVGGESYEVALRVVNEGNTQAQVELRAESGRGYSVEVAPSVLTLTATQSESVVVTVSTKA